MRDPRLTVVLGGLLAIGAMVVAAVVATRPGITADVRALVFVGMLVGMLVVMVVSGILTLRDWSRPRRRR